MALPSQSKFALKAGSPANDVFISTAATDPIKWNPLAVGMKEPLICYQCPTDSFFCQFHCFASFHITVSSFHFQNMTFNAHFILYHLISLITIHLTP